MTPEDIKKLPTPATESVLASLGFAGSGAKIAQAMRSLEQQRDAAMIALREIEDHHNETEDWRVIARETLASIRSMK